MKKTVAIIGGGAAGLMLSVFLDPNLFEVTIYERKKTMGRKLLVAGKGGFNLTHSEPIADFIQRYQPTDFLEAALRSFDNTALRNWLLTLDIPTFVGTSKRVYPKKGIKPMMVLQRIIDVLHTNQVTVNYEELWAGWNEQGALTFASKKEVKVDYVVFCMGGGSWKVTGSDGAWTSLFKDAGIGIVPFIAANCAVEIAWKPDFIAKNGGEPLKNITITCNGETRKGEVVLTDFGLEGNAIYALSYQIQQELAKNGTSKIQIDLKPQFTEKEVLEKIRASRKNATKTLLDVLKLSKAQISLLKTMLSKEEFLNKSILATAVKRLELMIIGVASIDEAISTMGGVDLKEVNDTFELKTTPTHFCIGEMLDWNAPTGGYLLQACFSMGAFLAKHLNSLERD